MNKWKTTLISLIIGILFAVACNFMPKEIKLFWSLVVSILSFLISFVFIELSNHIKIIRNTDINNEYKFFKDCGISEYHSDFSTLGFTNCISGATHIRIVLLYSNRFLISYINALQNFVAREGSILELIVLTDNQARNSYKYISEKFGYGDNKLKEKLEDFTRILQQDILPYKCKKSTVELYCTDFVPAYTMYMFDDYAYITLYKTAPQRTNLIPCFRVEKSYDSSFYNFLLNDFEDIKRSERSYRKMS